MSRNGHQSATPINEGDTVGIDDLDHFVKILTDWHSNKVKLLQHMVNIPDGSKMQTEGGTEITLTGQFLDGFKAGLGIALGELGSLPFAAETEEEESPQPVASNDPTVQ